MSFVYFIDDGTLVKIGASDSPAHRLVQIKHRHPAAKLIVAVEYIHEVVSGRHKAIRAHERRWHARYSYARIYGEWFLKVQPLLNDIQLLLLNSTPFIAPGCVSRVVELAA